MIAAKTDTAEHAAGIARELHASSGRIIDNVLPRWDATRIESRVVRASAECTYAAALDTDFVEAVRQSVAIRVLFFLRGMAERVVSVIRRRPLPKPPEQTVWKVSSIGPRGDWVRLGETPHREFVFGAVGRFWAGETKWVDIDSDEFTDFATPGYAKIVCNFHLRELGGGRTLLTYEARTSATDPESRRAFKRYWLVVSPFVGIVMRAMLRTIARNAQS